MKAADTVCLIARAMQVVEIQAVMLIVYKIQAVVHEANQNNADHMCT